jgi:predicted RNase H-like nuclease (RuvC/YqgF family)
MAKHPDNGSQHAPDHIEQIRDIILGPQKRQYDQRFEQMAADLRKYEGDARAHTDDRCDALQKRFEERLGSATADLTARLQRLTEANTMLQQELHEAETKLHSAVRTLREQLSAELNTHVSTLRDSKVSRESMADLLQEMAMKLKGVEVMEELTKAVRKKAGE